MDSRKKQVDARSSTVEKMVSAKAPRKQQVSKEKPKASTNIGSNTSDPKRSGPGKKQKVSVAKYRDPASDKTWSARGRKPNWLSGDALTSIWYRIYMPPVPVIQMRLKPQVGLKLSRKLERPFEVSTGGKMGVFIDSM